MVNKVILLGNTGKDPEIRKLEGGATVATFSLATSETYKDKSGEKQTVTEWHNIVIWNKLAEVVEKFVGKGDRLYLEGKIRTRSYEKDGEKKYVTEVMATTMQMLTPKSTGNGSGSSAPPPPKVEDLPQEPEADDLPF